MVLEKCNDDVGNPSVMASNPTSGVIRRKRRPTAPSFRFYPYATGTVSGNEEMKEEVVRLGVELSLSVAESMFLLCDDIRTLLCFCYKLWRCTIPYSSPVSERLLRVISHVYSKDIKPKNGVYQEGGNSVHCELITTMWQDFADGIIVLHRLVMVLRRKDCSFDDRLLLSAIQQYKHVLKKLDDKLTPAKHVSEANGFAREMIESNISDLWKSLFGEEATPNLIKARILSGLFQPILGKPWHSDDKPKAFRESWHSEILTLPVKSSYILGKDFVKQELKEEVVQLGLELSLHVAELMFLLSDDIRTMLLFCYKLWIDAKRDLKPDSPVVERLLRVMHYVYSKYIKPKNGVYQIGGQSVQFRLIMTTWENLNTGIRDLDLLVKILRREGSFLDGREFTSSIEEALKKVDEKLRSTKDVSEANGIVRDVMESNILDFWKSLFDKETEVAWTVEVMKDGIICDLFNPVCNELGQH